MSAVDVLDGWRLEPKPDGQLVHRPGVRGSAAYFVTYDGGVLRRWPWSRPERLTALALAGLLADATRPGRNQALRAALGARP